MSQLSHPPVAICRVRRRRRRPTYPRPVRRCCNEAARWRALEEREFGRLAQEADHLFDTSLSW